MLSKNKNAINSIKGIAVILVIFAIPVALIGIQPDFGTAAVFVSITFFMLFKAGLNYKYILVIFLIFLILAPIIYFFVLNPIQQERILVFFNPERDPLGSGYNAIQSKLAVGSGMLFGTGLLKGTQTQYGYLPVKSTDFIYSVISEEMGFVVSAFIIVIYVVMLLKILNIANTTEDVTGSMICMGVFGMIFFHFFENIGMTIGLMPITGIPLPFLSYGGSSMLVNFIAMGLVLSICARRKTTLF
jgi:rod shape determining protein RodA